MAIEGKGDKQKKQPDDIQDVQPDINDVPAEAVEGKTEEEAVAVANQPAGPVMQQCIYCARYFEEQIMGLHHDVCDGRPKDAEPTEEQVVAHSPAGLRPGQVYRLKGLPVKVPYSRQWLEQCCDDYENATPEGRQALAEQGLAFWRVDYYHTGDTTRVSWNRVVYAIRPGSNRVPNVIVSTLTDSNDATRRVWDRLEHEASRSTPQGGTSWAPGAGFLRSIETGGEASGDIQVLREV